MVKTFVQQGIAVHFVNWKLLLCQSVRINTALLRLEEQLINESYYMQTICGFELKVCDAVPDGEAWLVQDDKITGKITNIGVAAQKKEESGGTASNRA